MKKIRLTPTQQNAFDTLTAAASTAGIVELRCVSGMGRTTMLRELHTARGGAFLGAGSILEAMEQAHPLALEEAIYRRLLAELSKHDTVILDDVQLLNYVIVACGSYPRGQYFMTTLAALADYCDANGKHLVLGADMLTLPLDVVESKGRVVYLEMFDVADYEAIGRGILGNQRAAEIEFAKVFRFARRLTARQLDRTFESLASAPTLDTDRVIDELRSQQLASNVDIGEVQEVELKDLKGIDDVIAALEAHIIIPLERVELAGELDLKPKRGVLLAGPPGTGKTSIGRALARRLRGKFFLIDGTFIHGSQHFYGRVHQVFEAAKANAPGIIFIDDSDVIFESGGEAGLYRYLLTMLDGLESESAGRICVMMTAMDVGNLPPALVRSGRIELWLETRYPDLVARRAILADRIAGLPKPLGGVPLDPLAEATDGLSGADLKRVVEDAKVLFVYDRARDVPVRAALDYFMEAAETVRANRERYAEAEARARSNRPNRPPIFDVPAGAFMASGLVEMGLDTLEQGMASGG
ncbi:MAG TPA: ATP-binding protein [Gemmatimonadaceae bacterium]|jgi:ATP-dependent 26S proteasome regulatory subunit|nr:ATP-binding protein [Gemmatimonadaceae bacterium]